VLSEEQYRKDFQITNGQGRQNWRKKSVSSILHVFLRIGFFNWTILQETDVNIFQRTSRRGHHAFSRLEKRVSTFIESAVV